MAERVECWTFEGSVLQIRGTDLFLRKFLDGERPQLEHWRLSNGTWSLVFCTPFTTFISHLTIGRHASAVLFPVSLQSTVQLYRESCTLKTVSNPFGTEPAHWNPNHSTRGPVAWLCSTTHKTVLLDDDLELLGSVDLSLDACVYWDPFTGNLLCRNSDNDRLIRCAVVEEKAGRFGVQCLETIQMPDVQCAVYPTEDGRIAYWISERFRLRRILPGQPDVWFRPLARLSDPKILGANFVRVGDSLFFFGSTTARIVSDASILSRSQLLNVTGGTVCVWTVSRTRTLSRCIDHTRVVRWSPSEEPPDLLTRSVKQRLSEFLKSLPDDKTRDIALRLARTWQEDPSECETSNVVRSQTLYLPSERRSILELDR